MADKSAYEEARDATVANNAAWMVAHGLGPIVPPAAKPPRQARAKRAAVSEDEIRKSPRLDLLPTKNYDEGATSPVPPRATQGVRRAHVPPRAAPRPLIEVERVDELVRRCA